MLEGPYVPRALLLGLQNASFTYLRAKEPAYLVNRTVGGRAVECLEFGSASRSLGSACLARSGLIAFYDLPPAVTYSDYRVATLESSTSGVSAAALNLPASAVDVLPPRTGKTSTATSVSRDNTRKVSARPAA